MSKKQEGQTSMILIVLAIIIFMGLGVFMLTSSFQAPESEFDNFYVHNLLVSVMRRSSGYKSPCSTMGDIMSCSLFPDKRCEDKMYGAEKSCKDLSDEFTPVLIRSALKLSYDYYLEIRSENMTVSNYGNPDVRKKPQQWAANEKLAKYGGEVTLIIAKIS